MGQERVRWLEHKGRKVLYLDGRKVSSKEFMALLDEADALMRASPDRVLYLGNIDDAGVSPEVMQHIRSLSDRGARRKIKKLAVVGATGVKRVLMDAVAAIFDKTDSEARPFATEAEALDWLVKQEGAEKRR